MLLPKVHTYSAGVSAAPSAGACAAAAAFRNASKRLRTAPTSASSGPSNAPRFVTKSIIVTQP